MFDTSHLALLADGPPSLDMSRYLLACLAVLGLLCFGAWFLARLGRSSIVAKAKKRSLKVVDVLPLGRKQKLCVVRAYDRTFVLGVGEREVSLVAEIDRDDDLAVEALELAKPKQRSFADLVRGATDAARSVVRPAVAANSAAPVAADELGEVRPLVQSEVRKSKPKAAAAATSTAKARSSEALLALLDERRAASEAPPRAAKPAQRKTKPALTEEPAPTKRPVRKVERAQPRPETAAADEARDATPRPSSWVG